MKNRWSGLTIGAGNTPDTKFFSQWMGKRQPLSATLEGEAEPGSPSKIKVDNRPIEPEGNAPGRPSLFKWAIFFLIIVYTLVSYFHVPMLTRMGEYLVVRHPLERSDLIVCMAGGAVERGLETADVYNEGLAPMVLVSRERLPDGQAVMDGRGVHYPESRDLSIRALEGLGVPRSAIIACDSFVESTFEEADAVREVVLEKGYGSLIIVTSPTHTRRSWLTFQKVFEEDDVKVQLVPSRYSEFRSDDWWKTRRYLKEVLLEYQKLLYYTVKYFW